MPQRALEIVRELGLRSNQVVEVVAEELCAALPAVAVKYREELDLEGWLLGTVRLDARLLQIEHD